MRKRSRQKSFVSAIVVTIASGCGGSTGGGSGGECCYNPPPILAFQGLEVGDRISRSGEGDVCNHYHSESATSTMVNCPSSLPGPGSIWRNGEECQYMPEIHCPPPSEATCNPPPPMPVPCPTPN